MLRGLLVKNSIGKNGFLLITILLVSVFGWYYMALHMIKSVLDSFDITNIYNLAVWATFYVSIIGSSILGSFLSNKVGRLKFLYIWIALGVVVSFLPVLLTNVTLLHIWSTSLLLGASFGLGIPSCLAYFADWTTVENRGRIGGLTFLIANISVPLLTILFNPPFDLATISVFLVFLRGMGLIVFFQKPEKELSSQMTTSVSFVSILRDRTFLLYYVAWLMFPLLDRFERVLVDQFLIIWMPNLLDIMGNVEPLVAGLAILIAGLLCDWIGRKKIVLSGFVAIGIAYAIIGFNPYSVYSWYFYFIADGIAAGILSLIFVLILWGDIAQSVSSEKYYTLGSIPFFLSGVIPPLVTQSFIGQAEIETAFSLASFFLFAAVMPLVFVPETLPEKKMELRRLRNFAEDAKKVKEKYERKMKG